MNNNLILENDIILASFNRINGNIERIYFKDTGIEFLSEKRLTGSFRVNLQSDLQESNYIIGSQQHLSHYEQGDDSLTLYWDGPLKNSSGQYDISVKLNVTLGGDQLSFTLECENNSQCKLSEVWTPILGGVNGLGKREDTAAMIPVDGMSTGEDMFTFFQNHVELGIPIPEMVYSYPGQMGVQWCDIYNTEINKGVYIACLDKEPRYKSIRFELEPGAAHLRKDNWPRSDEFDDGTPIGLNFNWVFYPYTAKGESFVSPLTVIKYHDGSWKAAKAFYYDWFTNNFPIINSDRWQRAETSFLCTMFMLPESDILFKYSDIPSWVDSAKQHGVNVVMLCGWQKGGHDNGYPYYEPEPRLGTLDELKAGIDYAHSIGVKVIFFVNFNQMDTYTDIYKEEFAPYAISDQWGNSNPYGFGMGTVAARKNYTSRKLVNIDPSYKPMREYILDKLVWLAEIGADGLHIDKIGFSNVSAINLNKNITDLGYSPDSSIWSGILDFCRELSASCKAFNSDFCISVEGSWDRFLEYTDVVWMWHNPWAQDHICTIKQTFSQWTPCYAITQPNDYTSVNEAIRQGYQLFICPMNITASMNEARFAKLSRYIKEVNRIRESVRSVIYDGQYLNDDHFSIVSTCDDIRQTSFIDKAAKTRACVVTSTDCAPRKITFSAKDQSGKTYTLHIPFISPQTITSGSTFVLPGERFAVIIENL